MTELETLQRAKMYLDKLANGINPKNGNVFYGCTNYFRDSNPCTFMKSLPNTPV